MCCKLYFLQKFLELVVGNSGISNICNEHKIHSPDVVVHSVIRLTIYLCKEIEFQFTHNFISVLVFHIIRNYSRSQNYCSILPKLFVFYMESVLRRSFVFFSFTIVRIIHYFRNYQL